jgi:MerR family transcriptional regulator, light-induced transcriptional regulator
MSYGWLFGQPVDWPTAPRADRGPGRSPLVPCHHRRMELLSVGQVAARLGVSPSTVRMWGHRYGLRASARSGGGHRRYVADDVGRLWRMHQAVIAGVPPSVAAEQVGGHSRRPGPATAGPGGAVLAVPGAGRAARGLARAASRLDGPGAQQVISSLLRARGTVPVWDDVLRPVLVAAGAHWQRTGAGIDTEHVLTQAITSALLQHVAGLNDAGLNDARDRSGGRESRVGQDEAGQTGSMVAEGNAVLLAGGPAEEHVLALHASRAALAERGIPAQLIGPRTPMQVLTSAARRTRAAAVLTWLSVPDPVADEGLSALGSAHRGLVVLVGGRGWDDVDIGTAARVTSLGQATDQLERAWSTRPPGPSK